MKMVIAAAALVGLASMAPAAVAVSGTPSSVCPAPSVVQPFSGVGDVRDYVLAPGGSFESTSSAGWTLKKAAVVDGNEPLQLRGLGDTRSLQLDSGGTATSGTMCVDLNYPTFRLSVRALDPEGQADLQVEVRYPYALDKSWKGVRTESGTSEQGWRITSDIDLKPTTFSSLMGARDVQLRFTVKGNTGQPGWQLDNIFVDPRMH